MLMTTSPESSTDLMKPFRNQLPVPRERVGTAIRKIRVDIIGPVCKKTTNNGIVFGDDVPIDYSEEKIYEVQGKGNNNFYLDTGALKLMRELNAKSPDFASKLQGELPVPNGREIGRFFRTSAGRRIKGFVNFTTDTIGKLYRVTSEIPGLRNVLNLIPGYNAYDIASTMGLPFAKSMLKGRYRGLSPEISNGIRRSVTLPSTFRSSPYNDEGFLGNGETLANSLPRILSGEEDHVSMELAPKLIEMDIDPLLTGDPLYNLVGARSYSRARMEERRKARSRPNFVGRVGALSPAMMAALAAAGKTDTKTPGTPTTGTTDRRADYTAEQQAKIVASIKQQAAARAARAERDAAIAAASRKGEHHTPPTTTYTPPTTLTYEQRKKMAALASLAAQRRMPVIRTGLVKHPGIAKKEVTASLARLQKSLARMLKDLMTEKVGRIKQSELSRLRQMRTKFEIYKAKTEKQMRAMAKLNAELAFYRQILGTQRKMMKHAKEKRRVDQYRRMLADYKGMRFNLLRAQADIHRLSAENSLVMKINNQIKKDSLKHGLSARQMAEIIKADKDFHRKIENLKAMGINILASQPGVADAVWKLYEDKSAKDAEYLKLRQEHEQLRQEKGDYESQVSRLRNIY